MEFYESSCKKLTCFSNVSRSAAGGMDTVGLLAGSVVCLISAISLYTKTVVLFCSAGYTGLIFGFFGGILYLYQKTSPHKESSINAQLPLGTQKAA